MSTRVWFVNDAGQVVTLGSVVSGGIAQENVIEVVEDTTQAGDTVMFRRVWAAAGGEVSDARLAAAEASASTDPLPVAPPATPPFRRFDQTPFWHDVVTVDDARPDAQHVMWVGGTTRPTNMAAGDLWVKEV